MTILDVWHVLKNPAWISFGIFFGLGVLGLGALLLLYPLAPDE